LRSSKMTRMSKQGERRNMNPKKRKPKLTKKTGPKKDNLVSGYKEHVNAINDDAKSVFIPKIK
jgi:hypothetical protein